jgi:hypothetical protein
LPRSVRASALVLALVLVPAACGDDDEPAATDDPSGSASAPADTEGTGSTGDEPGSTGTADPSELPPSDLGSLQAIFDPLVEPMGLRLTRGALVDRTDGYEISPTGTHLALYVEPLDDAAYTIDDYVANIYDLTALVTPIVFDDYPGVLTYDICQEPYEADDDRYEPFPVTQIELTRQNAEDYDFATGDLASLLAFLDANEGTKLVTNPDIREDPTYQDAVAEAGNDPSV